MHNPNSYITYHRKSSENEERQIQSLERQFDETNRLVEIYKITVKETISESRSAMIPNNRPGFTKMITLIQAGEANGIVCWHLNRLARNPFEWGVIHQLLVDRKLVSIITKDREYTPEDNILVISVESGLSSQYSRDLGKAVKSGLDKKASLGLPGGTIPLGYEYTGPRGNRVVIPDAARWPTIRKAFDLLLTGVYSVSKIVEIINTDYHFRTRQKPKQGNRPLSRSGMYNIFTEPFYYGYFRYSGQLIKGNYPAMITVEEFDKIQHILGRDGRPRSQKHAFAFTGLIKCGICGASITASLKSKLLKTTGELKSYTFYHCSKRKIEIKCPIVCYLHEWQVEEMIIEELSQYEIKEGFKEWGLKIIDDCHAMQIKKEQELIAIQKNAENKITKEIEHLLDMRIANEIDAELYLKKKTQKDTLLIRIRDRIKQIENASNGWTVDIENKLDFVSNVVTKFKNGSIETKKEICHKFGWNWVLKDKKLLISKQEWLEPIKTFKREVDHIFGRFEPEKTFILQGQKASFDALRPILLALVNEVRAASNNKPEEFDTS